MKHEPQIGDAVCPQCGHIQEVVGWPAISKRDDPEAASELLRGKLFEYTCPKCGYFDVLTYTSVFIDEGANAAIVFGRTLDTEKEAFKEALPFVLESLEFDSSIIRWVKHVDEFSEKAKILDCGLDDRAVEVAKVMALRWLEGKDELHELSMGFFSGLLEDGDLIIDILAVSDTANDQVAFFRDKYDEIEEAISSMGEDKDLVVDRKWAECYLAQSAVEEADEAIANNA